MPQVHLVQIACSYSQISPQDDFLRAVGSVLYSKSKKEIGIVTAAMWSPSLKSNIAIGYVDKENMKLGTKILAEIYHPEELEYRKIWAEFCHVTLYNR